MVYSEKYGQGVDDAVRLALEELGLTEDQVMVTVLEEPSKGFLGIGQKLAKVRVEKIADADVDGVEDPGQAAMLGDEEKKSKANHDFRKKKKPAAEGGQGGQGTKKSFAKGDDRKKERPDARKGGRTDRPNGRGKAEGQGQSQARGAKNGRANDEVDDIFIDISGKSRVSEPLENLVPAPEGKATIFLSDVLAKMNLNVEAEGFENEECYYIEVKGEDARMVIGKRGQTLDSLQYLANLVSNKDEEVYKRVVIDVEGYRSRREKTLEQLAVKMAKKALKSGRTVRLEPMNPYERKVIHTTLQQVDGIVTRSEGDEPNRRIVIEKV
jgi:spoIIIJ-associated protein